MVWFYEMFVVLFLLRKNAIKEIEPFFSLLCWQSITDILFGSNEIAKDVYIPNYHKCPECHKGCTKLD